MWMPKTEEQINTVVASGGLEEGATFDAKEAMPTNKETAKDLAAMATDGGVIIYGIAEDESGRPTILAPIPLVGQRERIESIARTAIQEPVSIKSWVVPTEADPSVGYIVVVIPPSERAPHMVTVKSTNRYYGRKGTQNVPLTEGEVARLYERRQRWEADRDGMLDAALESAPFEPRAGLGYLHLVAQPVLGRDELLNDLVPDGGSIDEVLSDLVKRARDGSVFPQNLIHPDLYYPNRWERRIDGYRGQMGVPNPKPDDINDIRSALNLRVTHDGSVYMFCGRIADTNDRDQFFLFPEAIIGLTARFLSLISDLYNRGRYVGMVDLGLAVTGIKGAHPYMSNRWFRGTAVYDQDDYRKSWRVSAITIEKELFQVTRQLLSPFFRTIFQDMYDPISEVLRINSDS